MIPVLSGVRVWLATGVTNMRRGMNTLALQVQQDLGRDPHVGDLFVFRGRRGDLLKILWHDGLGISLYAKRLERGGFPWPTTAGGAVSISAAQLGYLLEGIEWRNPVRTWRPFAGTCDRSSMLGARAKEVLRARRHRREQEARQACTADLAAGAGSGEADRCAVRHRARDQRRDRRAAPGRSPGTERAGSGARRSSRSSKTGCARNAPASRATPPWPRRRITCSSAGTASPVSSTTAASA